MLTIRTAAEIRNEVAKLPLTSPELFAQFVKMECAFEAGRVKGYLTGKIAPVRAVYGDWNADAFEQTIAINKRIAAIGDLVRKRLEKETAE